MSKLNSGMMSNQTDVWATPQTFFDKLTQEFAFTLDPCSNADNAKCAKFYTEADDGLSQTWTGNVFMNPPYSENKDWLKKAYESACVNKTADVVVCLIPARPDTKYWHDYCMKADEIRFVKGRLKFGDGKNSAPFPSALIIFRKKPLNKELKVTAYERE